MDKYSSVSCVSNNVRIILENINDLLYLIINYKFKFVQLMTFNLIINYLLIIYKRVSNVYC